MAMGCVVMAPFGGKASGIESLDNGLAVLAGTYRKDFIAPFDAAEHQTFMDRECGGAVTVASDLAAPYQILAATALVAVLLEREIRSPRNRDRQTCRRGGQCRFIEVTDVSGNAIAPGLGCRWLLPKQARVILRLGQGCHHDNDRSTHKHRIALPLCIKCPHESSRSLLGPIARSISPVITNVLQMVSSRRFDLWDKQQKPCHAGLFQFVVESSRSDHFLPGEMARCNKVSLLDENFNRI